MLVGPPAAGARPKGLQVEAEPRCVPDWYVRGPTNRCAVWAGRRPQQVHGDRGEILLIYNGFSSFSPCGTFHFLVLWKGRATFPTKNFIGF